MADVEETTHRPALNGATRSYIVTAGVCFSIVGLLLLGYAQEEAAKKAKENAGVVAGMAPGDSSSSTPDQKIRNEQVDELARKSQGKFEALDKADQDILNGLSSGHGQQLLQMRWDALNKGGAAAPAQVDPETRIRELVERTQGDYSRLTEEERGRLDSYTSGHGKEYFATRVKLWKESLKGKSGTGASKASPPVQSR